MLALGIDPCTGRTFYPDDTHESRHLLSLIEAREWQHSRAPEPVARG